MAEILSGERVSDIVYDGGGVLECYSERGERLIINGWFIKRCFTSINDSYIPWGVFRGSLIIEDVQVQIDVHYKGDSGVIEIIDVEEQKPQMSLLRHNASIATLGLPNGETFVIIRDLKLPWSPANGILAGYVGDQIVLFIVQ